MDSKKIEKMLDEGKFEELLTLLQEEEADFDYDEYSMLTRCRILIHLGREKEAKKISRRMNMLFPSGKFILEVNKMVKAINEGCTDEYLGRLSFFTAKKNDAFGGQTLENPQASRDLEQESKKASLIKVYKQGRKKQKKERQINKTIASYFENVVGMEQVKKELDEFYTLLRFQHERNANDFKSELISKYNFAVSGQRGCGKTLVGKIISGMLCDFGVRAKGEPVAAETRDLFMAWQSDQIGGLEKILSGIGDATLIIENLQDCIIEGQSIYTKNFLISLERSLNENRSKEKEGQCSVVLTGTTEAMRTARALNETLIDAFYKHIEVPKYTTEELYQIAENLASKQGLLIHEDAKKTLMKKIDLEKNSSEFMNAITLKRFIEQASTKMAKRFFESGSDSEASMVYLTKEDFDVDYEDESLEELLEHLDSLTGLESVKKQIKTRIDSVIAEEKAVEAGARRKGAKGTLHMSFTGNPGTGKTMVAGLLGKIYQQLGILPRGNNIVEVTRSGLVGQYQGHTAKLVQEKVKEAMGGVLFIDEAYSLCRDDQDTFGHEAVDELIYQIENNKDNLMVILAGYKKEMAEFYKKNPGFSSRIRNEIEFEDYTTDEMVKIFKHMVKSNNMHLAAGLEKELHHMMEEKSRQPDFGNARGVRNLFDEVKEAQNSRIANLTSGGEIVTKNQYDILTLADIEEVAGRKSDSEKTLDELLEELNGLVGLSSAKEKVRVMVDDMQVREYIKKQYGGNGKDASHGTLHLVFKGNAGTGKTTVARLIGKIYNKLGILKKNVFIEVGRKDLVANYSGQTAGKVLKIIEEADGGILFIDEAYSLDNGERDEFGHEAITALVAELENRRDSLMVILAGYGDEMDKFIDFNQGLKSRLSNEIYFEDYTDQELVEIFKGIVRKEDMVLPDGEEIDKVIENKIHEAREKAKDFGNGRGVRNMVERIKLKKNSRVAKLLREQGHVSDETVKKIIIEDLM